MKQNINELKRQIIQKNLLLESVVGQESKINNEKIHVIKAELDRLLYKYYKTYKCG